MIKRGAWHQCGNQSQVLIREQLKNQVGVGVIMSPRDLAYHNAQSYARDYHGYGADVIFDPQFYVPDFKKEWKENYPTDDVRASVGTLHQNPSDVDKVARAIEKANRDLGSAAVLAPAVVYESGRPEIHEVNALLFAAAAKAGDAIGVPTLATVVIGTSAKGSESEVSSILAHATSLRAAGAYLACEFEEDRIPSDPQVIERFGRACLTLATSGWRVIHACAGPMALLSLGLGAVGAAIGPDQNLWQFDRGRWEPKEGGGGGGKAPPRFFSGSLWGTMVCPDELDQLDARVLERVMTHTPFSQALARAAKPSLVAWGKGESKRHMVHVVASKVAALAAFPTARECARAAVAHLTSAEALHAEIANLRLPIPLKTESKNTYQTVWRRVAEKILVKRADDYSYLELLA